MYQAPLIPKDPEGPLRGIQIGRISTPHQNLENIEASYVSCEKYLNQHYQGEIESKCFGEQGSGMRTDRWSIMEAEEETATGTWDLVLMEDLSRAYRNPRHQYEFVQDTVDAETRLICIGDALDTADPNWEVSMGTASLRHGLFIPDTRRRIRRTAEYAFHQGGMVQKTRYGYRKLTAEEAKSGEYGPIGLRVAKCPEATPIIQELCRRTIAGYQYESLADWLNDSNISPGSYVKSGKWTAALVKNPLRDPILQGLRRFRQQIYQPIFKTGKHRREKNANPEYKFWPDLAHLTKAEQEELWAAMKARNIQNGQKSGKSSPRYRVPRNRGIWPSKHVRCGICGDLMERTLNDQLKCKNAFQKGEQQCWNHVQVKAEVMRQRILPLLLNKLEEFPEFRESLIAAAWDSYSLRMKREQSKTTSLSQQIQQQQREQKNLVEAIRQGQSIPILTEELAKIETSLKELSKKLAMENMSTTNWRAQTKEEFAAQISEAIQLTARESFEFTDLMRDFVTNFVIQPVQALDSAQVHPRAKLTCDCRSGQATTLLQSKFKSWQTASTPPVLCEFWTSAARRKPSILRGDTEELRS